MSDTLTLNSVLNRARTTRKRIESKRANKEAASQRAEELKQKERAKWLAKVEKRIQEKDFADAFIDEFLSGEIAKEIKRDPESCSLGFARHYTKFSTDLSPKADIVTLDHETIFFTVSCANFLTAHINELRDDMWECCDTRALGEVVFTEQLCHLAQDVGEMLLRRMVEIVEASKSKISIVQYAAPWSLHRSCIERGIRLPIAGKKGLSFEALALLGTEVSVTWS